NIFSTPFELRDLAPPGVAIPDLEMLAGSRYHDLTSERRVFEQRRRNHHAALFVELGLGRPREVVALEPPRRLAERTQRGESLVDASKPILTTEGVDAAIDSPGEHDTVRKGIAEPGGKGEAILVIDRVLVGAEEHVGPRFRSS